MRPSRFFTYLFLMLIAAGDIKRLLNKQPKVPGMPASSPGMNTVQNKPSDVYLFDTLGRVKLFNS